MKENVYNLVEGTSMIYGFEMVMLTKRQEAELLGFSLIVTKRDNLS